MNVDPPALKDEAKSRSLPPASYLAAIFVLILALVALLVPKSYVPGSDSIFLVVDPLGAIRGESCYRPLLDWIEADRGDTWQLKLVSSGQDWDVESWDQVGLVLCPDGVALGLPTERFVTLAVGRRQAPRNLRARSVLVRRKSAPVLAEPWFTVAQKTIMGDSLSLAGCGVLRHKVDIDASSQGRSQSGLLLFGPDPYDHSPALHALRLGCFDYAVVGEQAYTEFLTAGLLPEAAWDVKNLSGPLPGVVIMVARSYPAAVRMRLGEILMGLGRHPGDAQEHELAVLRGLAGLNLDGFNLLLPADFQQVRNQYDPYWPPAGD